MNRLYRLQTGDLLKKLIPTTVLSGFLFVLSCIAGCFSGRLADEISTLVFVGALLAGGAGILLMYLLSWLQFRDVFYTRKAYLYRTLGLSRSALLSTSLLSSLCALLCAALWVCVLLAVKIALVGNMREVMSLFPDMGTVFVLLTGAMALQGIVLLLNGILGLVLGYLMKSDHLGWSVLFGILIYIGIQAVLGSALFGWIFSTSPALLDSALISLTQLQNMLTVIGTLYLILGALMLAIAYWRVRKGVDVVE